MRRGVSGGRVPTLAETRYAAFGMTDNRLLSALVLVVVHGALAQSDPGSWKSILRDAAGKPAAAAVVEMRGAGSALRCRTDGNGAFELREIAAGRYSLGGGGRGATGGGGPPPGNWPGRGGDGQPP